MSCYLCGSTVSLTADHVPPKGFFPQPRPTNLITVSCCKACNNSFSKDDEAMRLWLSANIARSKAADWIWENKVLPRTVVRSPTLVDKMLESSRDVVFSTDAGEQEATAFEIPADRVERFVVRVTKGLLRHYFPDYDYSSATFDVRSIPPTASSLALLNDVKERLDYDFRGEGVFQFRRGLTDTKESGVWLLLFYESTLFLVAHSKNKWGAVAVAG